jgi:hypothetical protein
MHLKDMIHVCESQNKYLASSNENLRFQITKLSKSGKEHESIVEVHIDPVHTSDTTKATFTETPSILDEGILSDSQSTKPINDLEVPVIQSMESSDKKSGSKTLLMSPIKTDKIVKRTSNRKKVKAVQETATERKSLSTSKQTVQKLQEDKTSRPSSQSQQPSCSKISIKGGKKKRNANHAVITQECSRKSKTKTMTTRSFALETGQMSSASTAKNSDEDLQSEQKLVYIESGFEDNNSPNVTAMKNVTLKSGGRPKEMLATVKERPQYSMDSYQKPTSSRSKNDVQISQLDQQPDSEDDFCQTDDRDDTVLQKRSEKTKVNSNPMVLERTLFKKNNQILQKRDNQSLKSKGKSFHRESDCNEISMVKKSLMVKSLSKTGSPIYCSSSESESRLVSTHRLNYVSIKPLRKKKNSEATTFSYATKF